MRLGELWLLAVALSMDAAAVSLARGLRVPKLNLSHLLKVALFFGGFQALMPWLGFWVGKWLGAFLDDYGHWVALAVFWGVGAKMLWEAKHTEEAEEVVPNPLGTKVMFLLAIATSLDAFAAGITLPLLHVPLLWSVLAIGSTTAILSALALWAGKRVGALGGEKLESLGGWMLIGLGINVVIQHVF